MNGEIYIVINKEWFEKNKAKFEENADEEGNYQIDDQIIREKEVELGELQNDNNLYISQIEVNGNLYVSLDWQPEPETIVEMVENVIDDIKGESLSKIIELVVKKLNKLRTFLESIRGL